MLQLFRLYYGTQHKQSKNNERGPQEIGLAIGNVEFC